MDLMLTTQHGVQTLATLERIAAHHNLSKEQVAERVIQQVVQEYIALERDVQEGFDAIARGDYISDEESMEEMRQQGIQFKYSLAAPDLEVVAMEFRNHHSLSIATLGPCSAASI